MANVIEMLRKPKQVILAEGAKTDIETMFNERVELLLRNEIKPLRDMLAAMIVKIDEIAKTDVIGKEEVFNPSRLAQTGSRIREQGKDSVHLKIKSLSKARGVGVRSLYPMVYSRFETLVGWNPYKIGKERGKDRSFTYINTIRNRGKIAELETIVDDMLRKG